MDINKELKLPEVMDLFDNRVFDGGDYCWDCYGYHSWSISLRHNGIETYIVYDLNTLKVFTIEVFQVGETGEVVPGFAWVDPEYKQIYETEAAARDVKPFCMWDDKFFNVIADIDKMIEITKAMIAGDPYDYENSDGVTIVNIELPQKVLVTLSLKAHEKNITLNEYIMQICRDFAIEVLEDNG